MPTTAIGAVAERYAALTTTGLPVLWFGKAQPKLPSGATTSLPIVEYYDETDPFLTTFEAPAIQSTTFRIEVWAEEGPDVVSIMESIVWDGQSPESKAGFWFPLTFPTPTNWVFMSCDPESHPQYEPIDIPQSTNSKQIHHGVFRFTTQFKR
jgi:hypothetical protein